MAFRVIAPAAEDKPKFKVIKPAQEKRSAAETAFGLGSVFNRSIPFMDEAGAGLAAAADTVGDLATGNATISPKELLGNPLTLAFRTKAFQDRYRKRRDQGDAAAADFERENPTAANLTKGAGLAVQMLPAFMTGGATATPTIAATVPKGLMGATARALKPAADAAVVSGLSAQLAAYGGDGTLAERAETARRTTVPAMAIGAALPVTIAAASKGRRLATDAGRATGRTVSRLANRATGGKVLDPNQEALKRLGEALKADGLGPQDVRAALSEWQQSGASSPALMDLAGENTRALLRAAASKPGAARSAAVRYADEVAADLQGNALARARALTPDDARPAVRMASDLEDLQGRVADEMYPAPYAERVGISDDVVDALTDEPGRAALRRARAAAVARRNPQQVAEIDALLATEPQPAMPYEWFRPPPAEGVSGGTLDRVRIAMGGRAAKMQQSPDTRDIAGGLFSRAGDIDAALDNVPGLAPARATYRGIQAQRDALELGGSQPFNNPDAYVDELSTLTSRATPDDNPFPVAADDIRGAAGVGLRSEMERMIGAPTEGATGVLNRLSTGTNPRRVLAETFGEDAAGRFRDALGREVDRVNNARFISPNTGSQTGPRLLDDALVDLPPTSKLGIAKALFDKLRRGVSLTEGERAALMEIGTSLVRSADDVPTIPTTPQAMRLLSPRQRARLAAVLGAGQGQLLAQGDAAAR